MRAGGPEAGAAPLCHVARPGKNVPNPWKVTSLARKRAGGGAPGPRLEVGPAPTRAVA
ncbi:hypothetical protein A176_006387 [Myxococcus hansupus]|uniref:Uncharacterized protein n=1 Tax=Pseudomyxococcus hansupus TaxID=1297742 RepID=A0A0H4X7A3_9BACT|nr:hypothetical protein A176_006387 [Myxococcus hansupus]